MVSVLVEGSPGWAFGNHGLSSHLLNFASCECRGFICWVVHFLEQMMCTSCLSRGVGAEIGSGGFWQLADYSALGLNITYALVNVY